MSKTQDLVTLSGVSRSTVFRFLRGENVRPSARAAILKAMQRLNIPHEEHAVRTGEVFQISIRHDFKSFKGYGLAISAFMNRAEAYGFQVTLRAGDPSGAGARYADRSSGGRPVGVLILGKTIAEEEEESHRLTEDGIPHVFVNRVFDDPAKSWVSCDLRAAAREAVGHLIGLGHREIGTWGIPDTYRIDRDKRRGCLDAFELRGLPVPDCLLEFRRHGDLEEAVTELIERGRLPGAWFACSDEHAMRFMKVARDHGIRIPEDIAIVGMDDVEPAEYFNPSLTTVHMPFHDFGSAAFDVLKHLIENPNEASHRVIMRHRLVIRESCGTRLRDRYERLQEQGSP